MDVSYCRELVVLADTLSFSKAAGALFITQSTLSKHVAAAEKEAGFRIFNRSTSKVELTDAGRVYIAHLREAVSCYDKAIQEGLSRQREKNGIVRVMGPLMNPDLLKRVSDAITMTTRANPDCQVSILETGVRDCEEKLLNHHADIAIAFRYSKHSRKLLYEHICNIPFGIACHVDHPLASKSRFRFDDLRGLRLTTYPIEDRIGYHGFVREVIERFRIDSCIKHSAPNTLCFPGSTDSVVFGVHFPDFDRCSCETVSRALDDDRAAFDVCVVRRKKEESRAVLSMFDNITGNG